jgi:hypothetical protein
MNKKVEEVAVEVEDKKPTYKMSTHIKQYRGNYKTSKSAAGGKSLNNGDSVAKLLGALSPKQVCILATKVVFECPDLVAKYAHLNPGQQRMNAGNRIRAAVKAGELKVSEIKAAIKA